MAPKKKKSILHLSDHSEGFTVNTRTRVCPTVFITLNIEYCCRIRRSALRSEREAAHGKKRKIRKARNDSV